MSEHTCPCGFETDTPQGLGAHQRHCDEYQALQEEDEGGDEEDEPVFTHEEEEAYERDNGACRRCGADGDVVHRFRDNDDSLPNLVTLCEGCESLIEGKNPHTKRTQVDFTDDE